MKRTLLMSVAAIALAAGSTVALSQGGGGGGGAAGSGGASAPMANPSGPSGGQDVAPNTAPGQKGTKGAQERMPVEKQKATQQAPQPNGQGAAPRQAQDDKSAPPPATRQSQDEKSAPAPATRQSQGEQPSKNQQQTQTPPSGAKQGASDTKTGQQGAGNRPMTSSNVSLTTEQKTTIRSTVINTGPRVTNVNFDIRVGTVVPRTVRVAPLPVTLIEIQPAWRGYMYFVYNDEIIVVEPGTLRIVAVIEV